MALPQGCVQLRWIAYVVTGHLVDRIIATNDASDVLAPQLALGHRLHRKRVLCTCVVECLKWVGATQRIWQLNLRVHHISLLQILDWVHTCLNHWFLGSQRNISDFIDGPWIIRCVNCPTHFVELAMLAMLALLGQVLIPLLLADLLEITNIWSWGLILRVHVHLAVVPGIKFKWLSDVVLKTIFILKLILLVEIAWIYLAIICIIFSFCFAEVNFWIVRVVVRL